MCFPQLLAATAGAALGGAGAGITQSENTQNAQNISDARNNVLASQIAKNNTIADDARNIFDARAAQIQPAAVQQQQAGVTGERAASINGNLPTINASTFPGAADSSTLVKSAVAKAVGDALATAQQKATAQATLGGYGDLFQRMGFQDADASRKIQTDVGFAQSNNALTPQLQDFAEHDVTKPNSGLGAILSGAGNALGSFAGSL